MDYTKIPQNLPLEIVKKIISYIDFKVPGAVAIKNAKIREIKDNELFSVSPPKDVVYINEDASDFHGMGFEEIYWMGFYHAHGLQP